ncbi:ribokinase [Thermocatellispora tengchongensis]|uniref:Ribokinase n=1 Tax=Thermocatellispora tengchongensis TaxID=1073253 RepID=A0A840NXR0_9ACTN|nr:ribokinase [Thermocatellispora tengchongensis]MBB5131569.1 ribokinase [Thermocatellispora tengchongensis]
MISVFGSANMDLVAYVDKAPALGETVTGRAFRTIPGGKGANQAIAAARAGAEVIFVGAVGDDAFGPAMRATLEEAGVDVSHLRAIPGPSGIAHIVVDDRGGNSIIVVPGANGTIEGPTEAEAAAIGRTDAVLLQLELPMEAVVAAAVSAGGAEVVLTPAPARPLPAELLDAVDLIVPNEHEAAAITGRRDPAEALAALLERVPEAVITLGAEGALYGARGAEPVRVPAFAVEAVDTTAAGDTFVGALAVARGEGRPPAEALRFASAAAALSVQREGASTSMPARESIDAFLAAREAR